MEVYADPRLPDGAKVTFAVIFAHCIGSRRWRLTAEQIARESARSPRSIPRHIQALRRLEYLEPDDGSGVLAIVPASGRRGPQPERKSAYPPAQDCVPPLRKSAYPPINNARACQQEKERETEEEKKPTAAVVEAVVLCEEPERPVAAAACRRETPKPPPEKPSSENTRPETPEVQELTEQLAQRGVFRGRIRVIIGAYPAVRIRNAIAAWDEASPTQCSGWRNPAGMLINYITRQQAEPLRRPAAQTIYDTYPISEADARQWLASPKIVQAVKDACKRRYPHLAHLEVPIQ